MKKYSLFVFSLLISTFYISAQNLLSKHSDIHRNCGTMQHFEFQKSLDNQLEDRMLKNEIKIKNWIKSQSAQKSNSIITIPVVVHVVYYNNTENISTAQVESQIAILNEDFRRLNADASNTPAGFQAVAADCEIEFCLATTDPDGNSTTGITRTSTGQSSFSTNDGVKYSSSGGIDAWNTSEYLNIWVCDLSGGLLGYAQFPGGAASSDGVVCDYAYFGNIGTATAPFNLGRTATHEVGHWLNLRHIWGDSYCGNDYCSDTPEHSGSNNGCPTYPSFSNCAGNGAYGDMFMNYMDYSNDACMNMFSQDQKTRMLASINTSRSGLLNSGGCQANGSGCTDPNADNYDPNATVDDGSCIYTIYGCMNPTADNYDPSATLDDGSCICNYEWVTITLTDSYGDGWNANFVTINGVDYALPDVNGDYTTTNEWTTYPGGALATFEACIDLSGCIDVVYNGTGAYSEENGWTITDLAGNILHSGTEGVASSPNFGNGCVIYGCTDPSYLEYNASATVDDGSCTTLIVTGCTDPTAVNYDPTANVDDGSCLYSGCTDPLACNYDINADIDDGSCDLPDGCTDPTATNYDPTATCDDGSCVFPVYGCTDPLAANYDPLATIDDGSCCYDQLVIEITVDNYPEETSWQLTNSLGSVIASINAGDLISQAQPYVWNVCIDASQCYYFTISDTYGDGICCLEGNGSYSVSYNGTIVASGGQFNFADRVSLGCVVGCLNDNYANYNASANTNTAYGGILDPNVGTGGYFNGNQHLIFDAYAPTKLVSAVVYASAANTITFELRDVNSTVIDDTTITVSVGGQRLYFDFDIPVGNDYQLGISAGNSGLYRNSDGASYPYDIGGLLNLTASSATGYPGYYYFYYDIEVEALCEGLGISGCTDPIACNYDPVATVDDGSCILPDGCTDPNAVNYDATALCDDGSCVACVYGCTDPTAFNYDPSATCDNGSCILIIYGCMDPAAINYNPSVNIDDGSCLYGGCTDPTACNYDANADVDDSSCFGLLGCMDFNGCNYNPLATCDDGNQCLGIAGCMGPTYCNYDPAATCDNGSCAGWAGCTDPNADNYNPSVNCDDGSCTYPQNCGQPVTGMFVSDIIDDRAVLNWDNMNTYDANGNQICRIDKLRIKYRPLGTATWLWAAMGDPSGYDANGFCNSTQVTSKTRYLLQMNTTYEWWMRVWYCDGTVAGWAEGPQFTTAPECPVVGNLSVVPFTNPNNGISKATFAWDDSNGPYVFCRIKMRVDSISNPVAADWLNVGGGSVPYGTFTAIKYGLTPGESYRAQAKGHCDPTGHPAYNSLTWTPLIFWTQPSLRVDGASAITNLDVYPNPSRDVFNISFTSESVQDLKIRVLNVVGEEIVLEELQQYIGEYTKQIDLTTNAKGVYFLEIETNGGIINKKLILQ